MPNHSVNIVCQMNETSPPHCARSIERDVVGVDVGVVPLAQPVAAGRRHVLVAERDDQVEVALAPEKLHARSPRRQRHVLLGEQVEHEGRDGHPAQPRRDAVRQVGGALRRRLLGELARRTSTGPASPGVGGVASVGAGIPGAARSRWAPASPPAASRRRARATRSRRAPTGRHRTCGSWVVSGFGSRRARLYTRRLSCQRSTDQPPQVDAAARPMLCFAAIRRVSAGKHFGNRDLSRAAKVMSCRRPQTRCRGLRAR